MTSSVAELGEALLRQHDVIGLAERDGSAFAPDQAIGAHRRAHQLLAAVGALLQPVLLQEHAACDRDGVDWQRQSDQLAAQVVEGLYLRLRDQAVDRIGGHAHDADGIGAVEHRLDQIGRRDVADVDIALVQLLDLITGARQPDDLKIDALAFEEALT
jgi:hypothetical protein